MGITDPVRDQIFDAVLASIPRHKNAPKLHRLFAGKFDKASLEQWNLIELKRWTLEYINRYRRVSPSNVIPEVYFEYVDSPEINAFAITPRVHDPYMGFNVGSVFLIIDLFYRVFSRPDKFPVLGNPKVEKFRPCHKEAVHHNYDDLLEVRPGGIAESKPIDFARSQFAEVMATIAFHFLMAHEMAHIRNGHCEYDRSEYVKNKQQRNGRRPFFFEVAPRMLCEKEAMDRQAMEYDADGTAAVTGFGDYFTQKPGMPRSDEQLIWEWVFAVAILLYLLECRFDPVDLLHQPHPPPHMRLSLMAGAISEYLKETQKDEKIVDVFRTNFFQAISAAQNCMGIFGRDVNAEIGSAGIGIEATTAHQELILKRWHHIRPEFGRFAY
jgi:hypothetical protein